MRYANAPFGIRKIFVNLAQLRDTVVFAETNHGGCGTLRQHHKQHFLTLLA
jgi:hypothetical protein